MHQLKQGVVVTTDLWHTQEFLGIHLGKVLLHSTEVFWQLAGRPVVTMRLRASPARGALPSCWLPRHRAGAGPASCC